MSEITIKTGDFVKIMVSNSLNSAISFEKKFSKGLTIGEFKSHLEVITGGCTATMQLELYNGERLIGKIDENDRLLGSYPIEDGMRVHVIDSFTFANDEVPKFDLKDEQYDQRQNTVRQFLKMNRLGKYNEEEMKKIEEKRKEDAEEIDRLAKLAVVGARCMVTAKGPRRIGTVMYNGPFENKQGIYIGVKFDLPLGVNDGTVNGIKYFECGQKYGSMVPISAVTIGDFPPDDLDLDEEL